MPSAEARGISVSGTGKVTVVPDVGEIQMAAQVTRPTVQQARDDARKAMDAIRTALRAQGEEILVHSGQHYDPELSRVFYDELGIAPPAHRLEVGSGSHAEMTARILERIESGRAATPAVA